MASLNLGEITIIGLIFIIIFLTLCFTIIGIIAYKRTNEGGAKSFGLFFQRALRFYTVLFIIFAIISLNIIGDPSDKVYIILSGLAGYVLGGVREPFEKNNVEDNNKDSNNTKKRE